MILILIILALVSIKPYLSNSFPYTHDGENHLARFANYKLAIREGQFPPRFAPNLLNHYGYPVFNYNYPLANILSLPFSFLKINYEITFKIIIFSFVLAGLIGVNKWLKSLNFDTKSRIFASGLFALTPYLINALSYRGNIGEVMAFCLLPWLLYFIEQPIKKPFTKNGLKFFAQTLVWIMFFLSHNIAVLFGTPLLIIYGVFKYRKKIIKQISLISSFVLGIISSLWFWLPAVFEKNLVVLDNANLSSSFSDHFPTLSQLLFSPLEFGFSKIGSIDSLSFQIGLVQIFIVLIALVLLFKKKLNSLSKFILFLTLLLFIFQLQFTSSIWEIIPLVNFIQFPWRLSMFFGVLLLPLATYVYSKSNKLTKILLLSLIFIQLISVARVKPADYFHKTNIDYDAFSQTTSTANENLPKDFTYHDFSDWAPTAKILNGEGSVLVDNWRGSKRSYQLDLTTESIIVEPTAKFLGWETIIDGQKIEYIDNEEIKGRLAYQLPAGQYQVNSQFTQNTWPRLIGNIVSVLGIIFLIILSSKSYWRKLSEIKNVIKK
jgi:hypothetical protein